MFNGKNRYSLYGLEKTLSQTSRICKNRWLVHASDHIYEEHYF